MTACPYCGRGNDAGATLCMGCGKPLGKSKAERASAAVGAMRTDVASLTQLRLDESRILVGDNPLRIELTAAP